MWSVVKHLILYPACSRQVSSVAFLLVPSGVLYIPFITDMLTCVVLDVFLPKLGIHEFLLFMLPILRSCRLFRFTFLA